MAGGFTPARKIAILGEQFGVKTAWHGPGDVSPVGSYGQCDFRCRACHNFGIQEYSAIQRSARKKFSTAARCWRTATGIRTTNPAGVLKWMKRRRRKYPFGSLDDGEPEEAERRLGRDSGGAMGTVIKQ